MRFLVCTAVLSTFLFSLQALAQGTERGGGNSTVGDFKEIAAKVYEEIKNIPFYQERIDLKQLKKLITNPKKVTVKATQENLSLPHYGPVCAINDRSDRSILFNEECFKALPHAKKRRLVFHEYLGLVRGPHGKRIDEDFQISRTLYGFPLVPSLAELNITDLGEERTPLQDSISPQCLLLAQTKHISGASAYSKRTNELMVAFTCAIYENHTEAARTYAEGALQSMIGSTLASLKQYSIKSFSQAMGSLNFYTQALLQKMNLMASLDQQLKSKDLIRILPGDSDQIRLQKATLAVRFAQMLWMGVIYGRTLDLLSKAQQIPESKYLEVSPFTPTDYDQVSQSKILQILNFSEKVIQGVTDTTLSTNELQSEIETIRAYLPTK